MEEPQNVEEHIGGHEEGGDEEVWDQLSSPTLALSSFVQESFWADGQRLHWPT